MAKGKSFQDRLLAVTWFTTNTNPQFRRLVFLAKLLLIDTVECE